MGVKSDLNKILHYVQPYLDEVDRAIERQLKTGLSILDESAYHLFTRGGKKIRASILILSSGLHDDAIPNDVVEIAAAAEIVHAASLIHDDIIDQSAFRRGDVTVSRKFGNRVAVLVGDFMYTRALQVAFSVKKTDFFPVMINAVSAMVQGELYQIEFNGIDTINKEHYFNIIEMKTARFMGACAQLGGIKADMSVRECDQLYNFGLNIGYAFQIIDDILDIVDHEEITGKDGGNDFINGKFTLPFLLLLDMCSPREREDLYACAQIPGPENWSVVRDRILDSGAVARAIEVARSYHDRAIRCLDDFGSSQSRTVLTELSMFLLDRCY